MTRKCQRAEDCAQHTEAMTAVASCRPLRHTVYPESGYTLIELMVVLLIAGIVLLTAIPNFQRQIRRHQIGTAANELFYGIQLTRTEAIARNRLAGMAPIDRIDWANGWHVYLSTSNAKFYRKGDQVLLRHSAVPAGIDVISDGNITYNGAGRSMGRGIRAGTWQLIGWGERRYIKINFQGRARLCNPQTDAGCTA